ncbi:MAG: circularly permuted type 2 ATP-grasp protein [Deltaproteobacteria bacterium]|nr:circularly permuted type 2 ATP-grasp protein [Deltaproteobacteria bacterium]
MHGPQADRNPCDPLARYAPIGGVYDELVDEHGALRPHWASVVAAIESAGATGLARRGEDGQRAIRDNGVTYNVYGDPKGLDRPWVLDPIPLLFAADEWKRLERGLIQRAELLDALLRDIYGPQALLTQGVIPPEVVFANPGFLRPCHAAVPRGQPHLFLYAADLARSPDGRWWIVNDRTQAPSGAGYAIENRVIVSQLFRDAFLSTDVARMAPFFQRLRDLAGGPAPADGHEPRVVLLSPGPYNETYFEHAYLARYLGYDLVEGGDLTARDNGIYWKTLSGLVPVDAILRRVDDDWCDPLELRPDSALGVPGLVQAVHSRNVKVANALGCGILESPAWLEILPGVCEEIRGEELLIHSPPTYWCGFDRSRAHVIEKLRELVIKPAFRSRAARGGVGPIFGEALSESELDQLVARMRERPHELVGQEQLDLATAPSWTGSAIEPRRFLLRAYVLVSENGCTVLPGGLGRISSSSEALVVSLQRGGGSKDVWVLSDESVAHVPVIEIPSAAVELKRGGVRLPSRVADNLFWLGRYSERCESATRVFRAVLTRMSDDSGLTATSELGALLELLGADEEAVARWVGEGGDGAPSGAGGADGGAVTEGDRVAEVLELVLADDGPTQLRATLDSLHHIAWRVRERLSNDAWRILNQVRDRLAGVAAGTGWSISRALEASHELVADLAAVAGLEAESMTRGHAWRFLDLGRRLERALTTSQLLKTGLERVRDDEAAMLRALLEVSDSTLTYRSRYRAAVQVAPVLDLLLVDETNPRSVAFQLVAMSTLVDQLPRERRTPALGPEQRVVRESASRLKLLDVEALAASSADGVRAELAGFLGDLVEQLPAISDELSMQYFSPATPSRQLASSTSEVGG